MASQVNLQPLTTYVWPVSKKAPMDAYQRRPWAKNNWTKTWEEKKNQKTPNLGKHICYELSILVDEHKRKNRLPLSHCMKKWPHTHVTKKSRLPDSKFMTVIVGWSSTGSCSVPGTVPRTLSYWFWNSPVKQMLFYSLVLQAKKLKLKINNLAKAPSASRKRSWALNAGRLTPCLPLPNCL